jgi:hypothetical protein
MKELRKKVSSLLVSSLLVGLVAPSMVLGAEAVKLNDIADSYAKTEIQALVESGIVSGYEDGSFQPRKAMTRAELAKIIVLSLGLKENADKSATFKDVETNSWYRGYVGALVESGITQGTSESTFSPNANVTREELVVFFIRAMGQEENAKKLKVDAKLADLNEVSSWAQTHVNLAFKQGFVQGIESGGSLRFSPQTNAERQALARLAYEFKSNKAKYVEKTLELVKLEGQTSAPGSGTSTNGGGTGTTASTVQSIAATSSTTVTVAFTGAIETVAASDFVFDNGLTVSAATKQSDTAVSLTTSIQASGTSYKLTYKGADTGKSFTGYTAPADEGLSNAVKISNLNAGGTVQGNVTLTAGSFSFGAGAKIMGTLTINPGTSAAAITGIEATHVVVASAGRDTDKVTLNNVVVTDMLTLDPGPTGEVQIIGGSAENTVVTSGASNSIYFANAKVKALKVNAANQTNPVRVVAQTGTEIMDTEVLSKATLASENAKLSKISVKNTVTLSTYGTSVIDSVYLDSNTADLKLVGTGGSVSNVQVSSNVTTAKLEVADQGIKLTKLTFVGKLNSFNAPNQLIQEIKVEGVQAVLDFIKELLPDSAKSAFDKAVQNNNMPETTTPAPADIHPVNYANGDDEVHFVGGILEGTFVKVYTANGQLINSSVKQGTHSVKIFVNGGFSPTAGSIQVSLTEPGKRESSKVTVDIPVIPVLNPTNVFLNKQGNSVQVLVTGMSSDKQLVVYSTDDGRTPIGSQAVVSGSFQYVTIPESSLVGLTHLHVAYFHNGAESNRIARAVIEGGSISPTVPAVTDLVYSDRTDTSITLHWKKPESITTGTVQYVVYKNNVFHATVTDATYKFTGLAHSTGYKFDIYTIWNGIRSEARVINVSTLASMNSVSLNVYGVLSAGNQTVTSSVYSLNKVDGAYDITDYPGNNYLVIEFSELTSADALTVIAPNAVFGLGTGVTASVYEGVYLRLYAGNGISINAGPNTVIVGGLQATVGGITYRVNTVIFSVYKQ